MPENEAQGTEVDNGGITSSSTDTPSDWENEYASWEEEVAYRLRRLEHNSDELVKWAASLAEFLNRIQIPLWLIKKK